MNMTSRKKIFIIVSLVVMVILVVSLFFLFGKKQKPTTKALSPTSTAVVDKQNFSPTSLPGAPQVTIPEGAKSKPLTKSEAQDSTVMQLAKVFVERFNTYSSDNVYQNIKDVKSIVTSNYWTKISAPLSSPPASGLFVGATTRFIGFGETTIGKSSATIVVKASKTVEKSGVSATNYYDYTVTLEKSGTSWLVNNQVEEKASST